MQNRMHPRDAERTLPATDKISLAMCPHMCFFPPLSINRVCVCVLSGLWWNSLHNFHRATTTTEMRMCSSTKIVAYLMSLEWKANMHERNKLKRNEETEDGPLGLTVLHTNDWLCAHHPYVNAFTVSLLSQHTRGTRACLPTARVAHVRNPEPYAFSVHIYLCFLCFESGKHIWNRTREGARGDDANKKSRCWKNPATIKDYTILVSAMEILGIRCEAKEIPAQRGHRNEKLWERGIDDAKVICANATIAGVRRRVAPSVSLQMLGFVGSPDATTCNPLTDPNDVARCEMAKFIYVVDDDDDDNNRKTRKIKLNATTAKSVRTLWARIMPLFKCFTTVYYECNI